MIRVARSALAVLLPLTVAACVEPEKAMSGIEVTDTKPATASYACGEDGAIVVQTLSGTVLVTGPAGDQVELPASPAEQDTRYGQQDYAVVLEGEEALYMEAGRTPLTCRRRAPA